MATTENNYTGSTATTYSFTFPYLKSTDVKVSKNGTVLTKGSGATEYTQATTSITLGAAPLATDKIRIYRETGDSDLTATFYPGSAIKSSDLNDNFTQNLYSTQEVVSRYLDTGGLGTMTGDLKLGKDADIIFEGNTEDGNDVKLTVADGLSGGVKTITFPDETGTVVTTVSANVIDSDHYVDGSIDNVHLADDAVDSDEIAAGAIDLAHMSANSVDSDQYVDGSIDRVHLAADIIDGTKIADDVINSEHYAAGSIDLEHMSANSVDSDQYVDGSIDGVHIANDAIDSQHYVDGSIDRAHLAADIVNGDKIANYSIESEHYAVGSIDNEHFSAGCITGPKIATDAINADKIADDVVNSEHYAAASIDTEHIADLNITTGLIANLNVTEGKLADNAVTIAKIGCEQTTITDSDSHVPTSGAVVDYVAGQLAPIGGFEAIATEVAFPATASQPASGVIISISDAAGVVVNGSGVSTTGRTTDGTPATVTINNFPSSLYSETLAAGVGLMVSSTGSSNTYNYHKILAAEGDVKQLSDDINDFNARYRVNAGEPGSANDEGDLCYDTSANKMKVYDGSAWGEVTSTGDYKYLFLCPAGGTGAPTINGSIATYDLREDSNSGSAATVDKAAQLLVSVNGVMQKPNTGTSAPAEGFALVDSNTIIFGANLPTGAEVFITQVGTATTLNTPADNSVTTAKIASAAVTTAKIADDAVDGSKLANNIDIAGTLDVTGAATFDSTGTFSGNVQVGGTPSGGSAIGTLVSKDGYFHACRDTSTYVLWAGYTQGTSDATSLILASGAATFYNSFNIKAPDGGSRYLFEAIDAQGAQLSLYDSSDAQNTKISAHAAYPTFFGTNVGIGTTSPEDLLHLYSGDSGQSGSLAAAQFVLESSGSNNWIHFKNPNTQNAGLIWSDAAATERAYIYYDHNVDKMYFKSDGTGNNLVLDSGNVGIGMSTPYKPLSVTSGGDNFNVVTYDAGGGSAIWSTNGGASSTPSDYEPFGIYAEYIQFLTRSSTFTATERMRIRDDGGYRYFCSDTYEICTSVANDSANQSWRFFTGATAIDTGTLRAYIRGDGGYYFAGSDVSDKDLKENITNLGSGSLNLIKQLTPCTYNFKVSEGYDGNPKTGFIAQNVASVFGTSNGVATGTDGQKDMCVDYNGITAHLTAALQEAIAKIETLETKVAALEAA